MKFETGHTIASICSKGRITYKPDWSPTKPWCIYLNGTAITAFATKSRAIARLEESGLQFDKKDKES